jgi:hypothetical protein
MSEEFVAAEIEPIHHKYPEAYVLHYMDDILISHPSESTLLLILADLTKGLGIVHCPGKLQKALHFQYLGQVIDNA